MAPKQLVSRNHAISHWPATAGLSRGIQGNKIPSEPHDIRCSVAAPMLTTFGDFHLARKGATKIWRKFPTNGSALISPIVVFGSTYAFATNAVMKTFTESDIVTIGMA